MTTLKFILSLADILICSNHLTLHIIAEGCSSCFYLIHGDSGWNFGYQHKGIARNLHIHLNAHWKH